MPKNRSHNLKLEQTEPKASYFVVDLKKQIEKTERKRLEEMEKNKKVDFYEKIANVNIRKEVTDKATKKIAYISNSFSNIKKSLSSRREKAASARAVLSAIKKEKKERKKEESREFFIPQPVSNIYDTSRSQTSISKINELAIFSLFRLLTKTCVFVGKIFYKLCYGTGWMTVFIGRFVYLLISKTMIAPVKAVSRRIFNFKSMF